MTRYSQALALLMHDGPITSVDTVLFDALMVCLDAQASEARATKHTWQVAA